MLSEHGVKIAPRTFYAWAERAPSKRALWDATITEVLAGYYEPDPHGRRKPESLYGSVKMWAHLQREGIPVAKSTVERLMRRHGWQGVRRQKSVRTTIADPAATRPPDLVDRQFGVPAPNRLLVADFTYVKLVTGVFRLRRVRHRCLRRSHRGLGGLGIQAHPIRGIGDPPGRCTAVSSGSSDRRCHPPFGRRIAVYEREIR